MTLTDIARLAGVSRTTASYVLNGQAEARRISAQTAARVMAVVEHHNFRIDAQAAALRRGASRTLGLIVPDLENASYARLAKLFERGARREGYQLLIVGSEDDPATERELALMLRARRCDALIVASALPAEDPFYAGLMTSGLPVVAVDRALDPSRFVCVVSDNAPSAEVLTRSVLDEKTQRVAWLDAVASVGVTHERREGFRRAVQGRVAHVHELSGPRYDRETGARMMRELLGAHGLPDALVTSSFTLMQGVLDVLLEQPGGLPRTLRMATFGDDRLLDFLPVKVNSLPQQHERIAEVTLARALEAIRGSYAPGCEVVARELKRRD
ncbi:catabolite repressor/activator [Melittangium boletus]|uniref:LacI family transcriptional regulator n=1 Tax=Melittangium boletus DSM 14713 TaxID=1294270 RepID=A0A250IGD3_9BACT|nr:catabolite repressor/activator [Melittangium boletus]ATB30318.1 LacI family transcriptional regulator [Melittangium boletus DSM 14713]